MSNNQYVVYKHTCTMTEKSYIGITSNLHRRTTRHQNPSSSCIAFRRAIQKHGWSSFVTTVLAEKLTLEQAHAVEINSIFSFNTLAPYGYNLRAGGQGGGIPCAETRLKMGNAHRGKTLSVEHRRKLSARMTGIKYEDYIDSDRVIEIKQLKSEALKQRHLSSPITGKNHPNAKCYVLVDPTGHLHNVLGEMKSFCISNQLSLKMMRKMLAGGLTEYKGWTGHLEQT